MYEVHIDKQGRIIDKQGRPLRQRIAGQQAFRGKPGKGHPRAERLEARVKDFDDNQSKLGGYRKPGSYKK